MTPLMVLAARMRPPLGRPGLQLRLRFAVTVHRSPGGPAVPAQRYSVARAVIAVNLNTNSHHQRQWQTALSFFLDNNSFFLYFFLSINSTVPKTQLLKAHKNT
jgi:hypothetical protein